MEREDQGAKSEIKASSEVSESERQKMGEGGGGLLYQQNSLSSFPLHATTGLNQSAWGESESVRFVRLVGVMYLMGLIMKQRRYFPSQAPGAKWYKTLHAAV